MYQNIDLSFSLRGHTEKTNNTKRPNVSGELILIGNIKESVTWI
jgi:hypothetical protein